MIRPYSTWLKPALRVAGAILVLYALWSWIAGVRLWRALRHEQARRPVAELNRLLGAPPTPALDARPLLLAAVHDSANSPARDVYAALVARVAHQPAGLDDAALLTRLGAPEIQIWLEGFRAAARAGQCAGWMACPPRPVSVGALALELNAQRLAQQGQFSDALREFQLALTLADLPAPEPLAPYQIVRAESLVRVVTALNRTLLQAAPADWPDSDLSALETQLARLRANNTPVPLRALLAERRLPGGGASVFERGLAGRLTRPELTALRLNWRERLLFTRLLRPWLRGAFIRYLGEVARLEDLAALPVGDLLARAAAHPRPVHGLARHFIPDLATLARADAYRRAALDLAWLGVRLIRHAARHGEFPAQLDAALPSDQALPRDPYADRPYRYRGNRQVALLSSVGPDGRDAGDRPPGEAAKSDDLRWILRAAAPTAP